MNNGTYTVSANDPSGVSSAGVLEFGIGLPGQKVMVLSGIAMPEMDTNDDDDVGHPRVFVRLGRFVRGLRSSSAVVGLASIQNDESGFLLATDGVRVDRDPVSGELFLDIACAMSGDGTWIHRIGYQAVCIVDVAVAKIAGEITWQADLRGASLEDAAALNRVLQVRSGRLVTVPKPDAPPGTFGTTVWEAFSPGTILDVRRRGNGFVATYEILDLPVLTPITVLVDVLPGFNPGRSDLGAFRTGGPDPVVLTGSAPEVDGVNFDINALHGPR